MMDGEDMEDAGETNQISPTQTSPDRDSGYQDESQMR